MSKVVKLFQTPHDDVVESLEYILKRAKDGEVVSYIFSCQCEDGSVATSYGNANFGKRAELIAHLQCDLTYSMIDSNLGR